MAISRRAAAPKGGRPTRRSARSCAEDVSEYRRSQSAAPRRPPFFPARPARADDANFAIASPPYGGGDDEHTAERRTAQRKNRRSPSE